MNNLNIAKMLDGMDSKWIEFILSNSKFRTLIKKLNKLNKTENITPSPYDIFNFAKLTPFNSIRIVVLNESPHIDNIHNHGLAFSSLDAKVPTSIDNIYKCLKSEPLCSDLKHWAKQGILLINLSMTTKVGHHNYHANIWDDFINEFIQKLSINNSIVFMLWGSVINKQPYINNECKIYVNTYSPHENNFQLCEDFKNVNTFFKTIRNEKTIQWNNEITMYTDGACSGNGKNIFSKAGYSAYFADIKTIIYGKVSPVDVDDIIIYPTNQRAEGLGIIKGLEYVISLNIPIITIVTDSNFWKDMIEIYMPNWERKNIDFKEKKNSDLTILLYSLVKQINSNGRLNVIHITSHNKNPNAPRAHIEGNNIADLYAVKGKFLNDYETIIEECQ